MNLIQWNIIFQNVNFIIILPVNIKAEPQITTVRYHMDIDNICDALNWSILIHIIAWYSFCINLYRVLVIWSEERQKWNQKWNTNISIRTMHLKISRPFWWCFNIVYNGNSYTRKTASWWIEAKMYFQMATHQEIAQKLTDHVMWLSPYNSIMERLVSIADDIQFATTAMTSTTWLCLNHAQLRITGSGTTVFYPIACICSKWVWIGSINWIR